MPLILFSLALTLFLPQSEIQSIGTRNINSGDINFISIEKEIAMGRQLSEETERQARLVTDPAITEYINRLGQNLARNSDAAIPITFKVIDSGEVNAFALPGGNVYIHTAVISASGDEAELAFVIAHQVAHVAARHGAEMATKGQIVNLATLPLIFLGGSAGFGIRQAPGVLIPMQFLTLSRRATEEADYLSVQYLYKAGYDPRAAIRFLEKIEALEPANPAGTTSRLFSTHPPTRDRIEKTQINIGLLPPRAENVTTTAEFQEIRQRVLDGIR